MARGNQREKAREKNQKLQSSQKKGTSLSGSERARAMEETARIMKEKQAAAEAKKTTAGGGEAAKK